MLRLWSRVLGRCPTELSGPASAIDFFDLGGTSLQLVGVQAAIQGQFDVSVPVVELFKKSSLDAMTALVATEIESPPRVVALTGATGFVGKAILRSLLATPSIDKIHCLAVRDSARLGEMCNDPKVVVHQGDLRDASLSLDNSAKEGLARNVDLIIHNGADVSFLKPYAALRAPNVSSTKFLATEIAAPRRIPITYISSAVVGRLAPELEAFAPVPMSHRPPPPGYRDAYGASKWASETVLGNANRDLGVPVTIRRLSSVTGAGIPESDIMGNLIAYSEKLAAVPVTQKWKGVLDFVSVDRVAQAVVADAMRRSRADEVRYRHDCSDEVVSLDADGISGFISQRLHGKPVKVLPMTEWIGKAKNVGMRDLVCTFLEQAEKESDITTFQRLLK